MGDRVVEGSRTARMFVLALFGATTYLLYWIFQPFISAIAWAIFLATAFYPLHVLMVRAVRGRAMVAAILSTALVASVIVVPLCFIVIMFARGVADFLGELQIPVLATTSEGAAGPSEGPASPSLSDRAATADAPDSRAPASERPSPATGTDPAGAPAAAAKQIMPVLVDVELLLSRYGNIGPLDIQRTVFAALQRLGQALARTASSLVQNVLWTLIMFAIMIFTMIYLFREGPSLLESCKKSLPLSTADRETVFSRLHEMTRAVFYGVFMTSAVQGILGGLGWWIVGLPSALTAGTAMFFFSLLPTGTVLVWLPGAAYLLFQGHPFRALILVVWGLAIVGTIDNVLRPYFISGRTRMHSLLVFFGVLGGLTAYGIGGLFLGPLLITLFLFLLELIQRDMFHTDPDPSGQAG